MIAVTGATGHLGRLAVAELLKSVPASEVIALARTPSKASDLAAKGVQVREADYTRPETLGPALKGVDALLFISASEVGQREVQHKAILDAAKQAGVKYVAYTSILRADASPLMLAKEHLSTERMLSASGIPHAVLRNGWYLENHTENLGPAKAHGALIGSSGEGRISGASRADYAAAAAKVVTDPGHAGKVYELAGDEAYSAADVAAEVAKQLGRPVAYQDLPAEKYRETLLGFGLPAGVADMLVDSDLGAAKGALFDDGRTLSKLIDRPTTTLAAAVTAGLKG